MTRVLKWIALQFITLFTFIVVFYVTFGIPISFLGPEPLMVAGIGLISLVLSVVITSRASDRFEAYLNRMQFGSRTRFLDTRNKRIWFVVLASGVTLMCTGLLFVPMQVQVFLGIAFDSPARSLLLPRGTGPALIFWIGLGTSLLGTAGSLGLIDALIRWIMRGR